MNDLVTFEKRSVRRSFSNELNSWAEDAILVEEVVKPKKMNHFIEANTQEVTLQHLTNDCIIPSFADMQETISHQSFINIVHEAAKDYFCDQKVDEPEMRASHPIHGRIATAMGKPAKDLREDEKTLFYERLCFNFELPTITHTENGNPLTLSITGTRAYNEMNLHSKKKAEKVKLAIGFTNQVCSNLMLTTDGLAENIEVWNENELYAAALRLFHQYNPAKDIAVFRALGTLHLTESEFCHLLGRMRLYQALPPEKQRELPVLKLGDSQINAAARAYISDSNFKTDGNGLTGWQLLNLLNGAAKSSYVDTFLEKNINCTEFCMGILRAKQGIDEYQWFLN